METDSLEKTQSPKLTPMMEQWHDCKKTAKEALLLFRLGDFYEAFYEDAETLARDLDLTLTQRHGIPMSGIPWHTSENYIDRLVAKGHRVAVAEQMEDPKETKGIVKRQVTRFVTPGTVVTSSLLSEKKNNYLACLTQVGAVFSIASLDVTTGEFKVLETEEQKEILNEICRLKPSECLVSKKFKEKYPKLFKEIDLLYHPLLSTIEEWTFDHKMACHSLKEQFKVLHLDGFGLKGMVAAINAAGALMSYVKEELSLPTEHIREIKPYSIADCLSIDRISQQNLELVDPLHGNSRTLTLLGVIDHTLTPMGGRLLEHWIQTPLLSVKEIFQRQDAVEAFLQDFMTHQALRTRFNRVRDLERLMMKISSGYASPRDLIALRFSLEQIPSIKEILRKVGSVLLFECNQALVDLSDIVEHIKIALVDEPPARALDGNLFKEGFHPPLDELRSLARHGKDWIARYQTALRDQTGIKTLKVNFNKIFGYYIEVSKGQASAVPPSFQRKQTLVNSERFTTLELTTYETKVLSAEEKYHCLEMELFHALRNRIAEQGPLIQSVAKALATIDGLQSLAEVARLKHYCRPSVDSSHSLEIMEGRHPVIETILPKESFIPNDTLLDAENQRLMVITGPNMAGKSTYIRQVALIVILAQIGSFVPAKKAHIGIVDKIFTRIGASDDLARGQSTFMVEMSETANILNNATDRSLVILDEIGRGTSTYDGVSIAWAVAEYLLTAEGRQAKTLFATHYWELTSLETSVPGAVNYHAAVQEWNEEIVFLHKIIKGGADKSYGIHVARLAGLPFTVVARAQNILQQLEQGNGRKEKIPGKKDGFKPKEKQLLLF